MPLHDVGYRQWSGQRTHATTRWYVLALIGIQLVWRTTWLKRTLLLMWLPAIPIGVGFFVYEQSIFVPELRRGIAVLLNQLARNPALGEQFLAEPEQARHGVWATLLLTFFRYPQLLAIVIVVGMIAPRQIVHDIRTRAFLLLFSRPITPFEYVLGKQCIIWFYLAMITTLPAVLLYGLGILLSPDLGVVKQTWDLPLRVLAASILFIVPTSSVALAYAALAADSRFAGFSWYATWVLGWSAFAVLTMISVAQSSTTNLIASFTLAPSPWEFVSPYHVLGRVEQWAFGLLPPDQSVVWYLCGLFLITVVSWFIVRVRIQSVTNA